MKDSLGREWPDATFAHTATPAEFIQQLALKVEKLEQQILSLTNTLVELATAVKLIAEKQQVPFF